MKAIDPSIDHEEIKKVSLRWLAARGIEPADREDIFQNAVSKMLAHLDQLKENDKIIPWFIQILRNTTNDYFRKKKTSEKALETYSHEPEINAEPELEKHLCQCFEGSLKELEPEDQIILRKHYMEGVSFDELAKELHKSSQALRTRATRAKHHVRDLLQKSCGVKSFDDLTDCCD